MIRITITLATGAVHSFERATLPRFWKSWAMQQLPYGTAVTGATFELARVSA